MLRVLFRSWDWSAHRFRRGGLDPVHPADDLRENIRHPAELISEPRSLCLQEPDTPEQYNDAKREKDTNGGEEGVHQRLRRQSIMCHPGPGMNQSHGS